MRHVLLVPFLIVACAIRASAGSTDNTGAHSNTGLMYAAGPDISKDSQEAVKAWQRAAEQGDAEGQYNLGLMYDKGQGVPQDSVRAYMWYHLAVEALSSDDAMVAIKLRDRLASGMTAAQLAKAREMVRHCRQSKFKECN